MRLANRSHNTNLDTLIKNAVRTHKLVNYNNDQVRDEQLSKI